MSDRDDDESTGYGNPPKDHQFKPGQSGNPKGRPKGVARTKDDIVARVLGRAVSRMGKDGEEQVPIIEHVLDKAAMAAANGDRWARRDVLRLLNRAPYITSMAANDNDGRDEEIARLTAENEELRQHLREAGAVAEQITCLIDEDEDFEGVLPCIFANYSVFENLAGFMYEPPPEEDEAEF